MKDKLNITIRLADQPPIALHGITPEEEEVIREAEYNINRIWKSWSQRFNDKSSSEVLAMVTFRFAQLYFTQIREMDRLDKTLSGFEKTLDRLVIGLDKPLKDNEELTGTAHPDILP